MARTDYYVVLGVGRGASTSGIRAAYRGLAKQYHPDRAGPDEAARFRDVTEAYAVLSDPERRRRYDEAAYGRRPERGTQATAPAEPMRAWRAPAPEPLVPGPLSVARGFRSIQPSLDELLAWVAGGVTGPVPKSGRVQDLTLELVLSPDEARRGGTVVVGVPVVRRCGHCGGSGRDWPFPCLACDASGVVLEEAPVGVRLPPAVPDGTAVERPLGGAGADNVRLRLLVRIAPAP
jgi:DnaJ-class molecular chaperone